MSKDMMIWFDFGGVLSPPIQTLFDIYESRTGVARHHIESAMAEVARPLGVHPQAPIELAMLTQREWGARIRHALGQLFPDLDTSRCEFEIQGDQWFGDVAPNDVMIDLFRSLSRQGYRVGILTNNVVEWEGPWRKMVGLDDVAELIVDSCKVDARKPDPRIFEIAAAQAGVAPDKNLLIDDVDENCRAARAGGWRTVLFETNSKATREICNEVGLQAALA